MDMVIHCNGRTGRTQWSGLFPSFFRKGSSKQFPFEAGMGNDEEGEMRK
jgi:hypothetical protein